MSQIEISKEEAIICFTAIENIVIKGKDGRVIVPLLDKLDGFISNLIKEEGQPDMSQIPSQPAPKKSK